MEHETSDKLCKNCGTRLEGPYCYACGQKYIEHKHSFFQLLFHFVSDFIHFDAQLFTTLKPLFTKPGLVAKDYVEGKRKRHLDPFRMYIFVSIVFFALFFSVSKIDRLKEVPNRANRSEIETTPTPTDPGLVQNDTLKSDTSLNDNGNVLNPADNASTNEGDLRQNEKNDGIVTSREELSEILKDSIQQPIDTLSAYRAFKRSLDDSTSNVIILSNWDIPKSEELYHAQQEALPKSERDGWLKKILTLKIIHLNASAKKDGEALLSKLLYQFAKSLPKLLFILLPFFALMLKLLYIRRNVYYVDHLIFMIYFFCFLFIGYSFAFLIQLTLNFNVIGWIFIWAFFYLYFAMRRFYGQSSLKTVAKFFIFGYLSTIVAIIGAIIGALISVLYI